jgi:large subunit ribosomal protein L22
MEATAKAKFQRITVRKARTVIGLIRGKNAAEALEMLRFTRKAAAPIVFKLLDSAISNARAKDPNLDLDTLRVSEVFADKAPDSHMRRWRPRAMGRATKIVKGVSHITLIVSND